MFFVVGVLEEEGVIIFYFASSFYLIKAGVFVDIKQHVFLGCLCHKESDNDDSDHREISNDLGALEAGMSAIKYLMLAVPFDEAWLALASHHYGTGIHTLQTVDTFQLQSFSYIDMGRADSDTALAGDTLGSRVVCEKVFLFLIDFVSVVAFARIDVPATVWIVDCHDGIIIIEY